MAKTNNDYLAEYVRQKRPEIEHTIDFVIWKLSHRISDIIQDFTQSMKKLTPEDWAELNRQMKQIESEDNQDEHSGDDNSDYLHNAVCDETT